jgi:hypothetical protein
MCYHHRGHCQPQFLANGDLLTKGDFSAIGGLNHFPGGCFFVSVSMGLFSGELVEVFSLLPLAECFVRFAVGCLFVLVSMGMGLFSGEFLRNFCWVSAGADFTHFLRFVAEELIGGGPPEEPPTSCSSDGEDTVPIVC